MGLEDLLGNALGGNALAQIAGKLGTDQAGAQNAIGAALPALLGRLKANADDPQKGAALAKALDDHDGSILDNVGSLIETNGEAGKGSKILGHVFDADGDGVADEVAQKAGIDKSQAAGLLGMLAPVVMGALGKAGGNGQNPAGVSNLLGGLLGGGGGGGGGLGALGALLGGGSGGLGALGGLLGGSAGGGAGGGAGGMMGKVTGMLDQNKDGSIIDDVTRMATGASGGAGGAGGKLGMLTKLAGMLRRR